MSKADELASLPNAAVFSAKRSTNQSIPSGAHTPIVADVELFDTAGAYNGANGQFTAPVSGYYQLNGVAEFTAAANNGSSCSIRVNGSVFYTGGNNRNDSSMTAKVVVSHTVLLSAGDYAEFCAYQDTGSALNIKAGSQFSGHFIRAS